MDLISDVVIMHRVHSFAFLDFMSQLESIYLKRNRTVDGDDDVSNKPDLGHLANSQRSTPAQFRLVPGFETLCLFLISASLGDPEQIYASFYFQPQSWKPRVDKDPPTIPPTIITPAKMAPTIDLAEPLRKLLQDLHDAPGLPLTECLSRSLNFWDRSATLAENFRSLSRLFFDYQFLKQTVKPSQSCPTFDAVKDALHLLFFRSGLDPVQHVVACDGLPAGRTIREAIRMFSGRGALFQGPSLAPKKLDHILTKQNEDESQDDFFCLSAIGTIRAQMTLVVFLNHKFYLISDRSTAAYDKFEDIDRLNSMRLYFLFYNFAFNVRIGFTEAVNSQSEMTYASNSVKEDVINITSSSLYPSVTVVWKRVA
jgi:hypothetical protein